MLNMNKISGNMISGINSEEISFLNLLTSDTDDIFFNQFTGLPETINLPDFSNDELYSDLDPDTILELNAMEKDNANKGTASQTDYYVSKFKRFLTSQQLQDTIETMPVRYLVQYLRLGYAKSAKSNGETFAPSTLICMRAAIQRYLNSSELQRNINIIDGDDFKSANNTLKAMIAMSIVPFPMFLSQTVLFRSKIRHCLLIRCSTQL